MFSRDHLARDVRTVVLALVVSSAVMATPAIAARNTNADTVDGKSAVGAGASINQRRGKLVATDRRGRLPSNIIAKAPNADGLDGLDFTAECPAEGSVVPVGWACVYEQGGGSRSFNNLCDPATLGGAHDGIGRTGFGYDIGCSASACWSYGTWAIEAPQPGSMRPQAPRGATPSR